MRNDNLNKEKHLEEIRGHTGRSACGILAIAELERGPSSEIVHLALTGLSRMEHRGGTLDGTGDGAGLLISPERKFFERFVAKNRQISSPKEPLAARVKEQRIQIISAVSAHTPHPHKRGHAVALIREGRRSCRASFGHNVRRFEKRTFDRSPNP